MKKIRIAIDPVLKAKFGNEIYWVWRLLFIGIGLPWEEVSIENPEYDIAYVINNNYTRRSRLYVRAQTDFWQHKSAYTFLTVKEFQGWQYPVFEGETVTSPLFRVTDGCWIFEQDIIFYIFWLVTGQQEQHWIKDKHGHFNLYGTSFYREGILRLALASAIGIKLEKLFLDIGFPRPIRRWPNAKLAAACVSHDVDYPQALLWLEPLRIVQRQGMRGLMPAISLLRGKRTHWHFSSWVSLEKDLNTKSAFYFTAQAGSLLRYIFGTPDPFYNINSEPFRNLFSYLVDEGCEIGLHASYRAFESQENFAAEKKLLEEASGQKIYGNRHHYWHLYPKDPESTLLLHEQIGLTYDTSLTHERYLGWRRGLSWPFFPFHQQNRRELSVLQIPVVWMDDHLFRHREDNPGGRFEILRALSEKVVQQGGCLSVDIHDYVFDEMLFPGWLKTYQQLWEYLLGRLDFWITTPGQIADHWIRRTTLITQASCGLTQGGRG